jgi:hypothetical protein
MPEAVRSLYLQSGLGSFRHFRPALPGTATHTVIWNRFAEALLDVTAIPDTIFGHHALRTLT